MSRAVYTLEKITPEFVVIRDQCNHYPDAMSVTNDAERVVGHLLRAEITSRSPLGGQALMNGQRILYYDTDGELDELCHDGLKFTGFAPWRKECP
jgi:hypothetical protein